MTYMDIHGFEMDLRAYNSGVIKSCQVAELNDPDNYVLEPKFDGFRLISHIISACDGTCTQPYCKGPKVESWTRSMKSQDGKIPYIYEELIQVFPAGTVVDGEIVALQAFSDPDTDTMRVINDFEHVQSLMLSKPEKAVAKAQASRPLDYVVFDITYYKREDIRGWPWEKRRMLLEDLFAKAPKLERVSITNAFEARQEYHDRLVEMGFEGTIAKAKDSFYLSGDRGKGWFKLKVQTEVDAVVVDVKPGTPGSEFDGMVGSLYFGHPLDKMPGDVGVNANRTSIREIDGVKYIIRGSCSGITLTERRRLTELWKNRPEELFGKVMSFKHMGKYPDGITFRHPQFGRWRPDKPLSDVQWEG